MSGAIDFQSARRRGALERALGVGVAEALARPDVVEALVNADGRLWLDCVGRGLVATDILISSSDREAAIRLLAHEAGETVGDHRPSLAAILPGSSARVQAILPPLSAAPVLAIRKRALVRFTLADYLRDGVVSAAHAEMLAAAVAERRNIVVAGGTGSGKTTLLNALLAEPSFFQSRVVILEDTAELTPPGPNAVTLLAKKSEPEVTMRELVQMSMRLRPDRIVVGEVRDGAALEVLKAWNTGHPGGLLSLHANSAPDALMRLEDLCAEAGQANAQRTIASAVDLIVFMTRTGEGRRISDIAEVRAFKGGRYVVTHG